MPVWLQFFLSNFCSSLCRIFSPSLSMSLTCSPTARSLLRRWITWAWRSNVFNDNEHLTHASLMPATFFCHVGRSKTHGREIREQRGGRGGRSVRILHVGRMGYSRSACSSVSTSSPRSILQGLSLEYRKIRSGFNNGIGTVLNSFARMRRFIKILSRNEFFVFTM